MPGSSSATGAQRRGHRLAEPVAGGDQCSTDDQCNRVRGEHGSGRRGSGRRGTGRNRCGRRSSSSRARPVDPRPSRANNTRASEVRSTVAANEPAVTAKTLSNTAVEPGGAPPPASACASIASAAVSSPTAIPRRRAAELNGRRRCTDRGLDHAETCRQFGAENRPAVAVHGVAIISRPLT